MKKQLVPFILIMTFLNGLNAQEKILLYPHGAKESNELKQNESFIWDKTFLVDVSEARMYTYFAPREKANGTAILICPGGGYSGLSTVYEGEKIAEWYNELGISAFVLYYRMPNGHYKIPLNDAQTAMKIIRKNAKKWHIDKNKIGVIGFSAGGHLASTLGTHYTRQSKPNFMVLVYPVISMLNGTTHSGSFNNLMGKNAPEKLVKMFSNELHVTKNTSPALLIHSKDDNSVPIKNCELFYDALIKNNVPAELKIYNKGGHGFSMKPSGVDSDDWLNTMKNWLKERKFIK